MAQLGSAPRSGRGGRRFKSCQPDQCDVSGHRGHPDLRFRRSGCLLLGGSGWPAGGLVVAVGVEDRVRGGARRWRRGRRGCGGPGRGVGRRFRRRFGRCRCGAGAPLWRRVTLPDLLTLVGPDAVVGVGVAGGAGCGFGAGCVDGGWGRPVRQGAVRVAAGCTPRRKRSSRACSSAMVEGWSGWARSHFFRVCWKRSTFPQVVGWWGREFFWRMPSRRSSCSSMVLAATAADASEPDGVDHAVVGQRGRGIAVLGCGFGEGVGDDRWR